MTEKRFNLRAGYYDEYTGICGGNDENFTTNNVVDLLNEQYERVKKLSEENIMLKEANLILRNNNDSLRRDNEELKKEIIYLQSELHNATVNIRKKTLNEVKFEIEKLGRWE